MAFVSSISFQLSCLALLYFAFKKAIARLQYKRSMKRHNCSRPRQYHHKDPILGTDLYRSNVASKSKGDFKNTLQSYFRQYTNTFEAHVFGETIIYTCEVENIKAISTTEFGNFGVEGIRRQPNASWIGEGVFVSDGEVGKHARKVVMPIFARKQVADLKSFGVHFEQLIQLIPKDGKMIDLRPLFRRLFLFGESAETLRSHSSKLDAEKFLASLNRAMLGVDRRMSLRGLPFLWGRATRDREWKEACAEVHAVVDRYIERALSKQLDNKPLQLSPDRADDTLPAEHKRPFSFLNELSKETQDRQFIRDQLISVFFPARDATAIAISDLFFQLARNPLVWTKLRAEVLVQDEPATFEGLKSMKYLQAVLNESKQNNQTRSPFHPSHPCHFQSRSNETSLNNLSLLRILRSSPPRPSISRRTCTNLTTLPRGGGPGGSSPILVIAGTHVDSHLGIMHRDTRIWGHDAEVFRPERWIEGNLRPGWTYVPFLGGCRICPAQQMVLCQMGFVLARFVREFEAIVNMDPLEEFVEEYMFSVQSRNGVKVGFVDADNVQ